MSVAIAAMFATALHQVNASEVDPETMEEAILLLTRAVNSKAVAFDVVEGTLYINDLPMPGDAPGVSHLIRALEAHGITRLGLPARLEPRHWREITQIFASVSALYPTADDIRDALRPSVPAAVVSALVQTEGLTDLRDAMFEIPGLMTDAGAGPVAAADGLTNRTTDRASFSERLDPILKSATDAAASNDYDKLARLVLQLTQLGAESDEATRTIVARERRRIAPRTSIDGMVRMIPRPETDPVILKAIVALGRDGIEAMVDAMSGASSAFERRAYIEALSSARGADEAILASLGSARVELVRNAAEVAGRRRMEGAVPTLGHLLRHDDERVRTAAWQALERIGNAAALDALYGQPTAGRSRSRE